MDYHRPLATAFAMATLLFAGCASEQIVWRKFPSTTFAELSVPKGATLRITSSDDPDATAFASRLHEALRKAGLKVAEGADAATHVVLVQGGTSFRGDTAEEARYTGRVHVETVNTDAGSFQRVKRDKTMTYTAAREISVAVYALKTLTPIDYLTFPIYEGGVSDQASNGREAERENRQRQAQFVKLAADRMEEVFASRSRSIGVPVPIEANGDLKVQFLKIEAALGANDDEELQRALAKIDALATDKSIIPGLPDDSAKEWTPPEGTTREEILGNYYLIALRREIDCTDPNILSALHAAHLRILELSEGPSLRMACPIALGRLEAKLARLRARQ